MDALIKNKVEFLLKTHEEIKKDYRWETDLVRQFAALAYCLKNKTFNKDTFDKLEKYIKNKTGIFSYYRSYHLFITCSQLITEYDDPEKAFDDLIQIEDMLKKHGFKNGNYTSLAAFNIMKTSERGDWNSRASKSYDIFKAMKGNHFWLTSADDYPAAALMSISEENVNELSAYMEKCYTLLNNEGFSKGNGLQFLSHLLTLSDIPIEDKIRNCVLISNYLKENKIKLYSNSYSVIGIISLFGAYSIEAANELIEVYNYLKTQKSFKWSGKDMNVMFASSLIAEKYALKAKEQGILGTTISTSIEALIAAQMAATAAVIASTSAAAAASSSS